MTIKRIDDILNAGGVERDDEIELLSQPHADGECFVIGDRADNAPTTSLTLNVPLPTRLYPVTVIAGYDKDSIGSIDMFWMSDTCLTHEESLLVQEIVESHDPRRTNFA